MKQGDSISIGFSFLSPYDTTRLQGLSVHFGSRYYGSISDGKIQEVGGIYRVALSGVDTELMLGVINVNINIVDSILGNKEITAGQINILKSQAFAKSLAINTGYDILFSLLVSETAISVESEFYDLMRGADGKSAYVGAVEEGYIGTEDQFYIDLANAGNLDFYTKPESDLRFEPIISIKGSAFNKDFGASTGTVLEGRTFGTAANSDSGDFANVDHDHAGVYEPADAGIQSHIADDEIHVDAAAKLAIADVANKVDKVVGSSLVPDTDIAKIHTQNTDSKLVNGLHEVSLDASGTLHVENISQSGALYETHAEQIFTAKDEIILRDGAVAGLGVGELAGLRIAKYDGANDGIMKLDSNGVMRVGDSGAEQPIATREELPVDQGVAFWDLATLKFKTLANSVKNGWDAAAAWVSTNGVNVLSHLSDSVIHVTALDKLNWNGKEDSANKKTDIEANKTSNVFFPSIKALFDWATGLIDKKQVANTGWDQSTIPCCDDVVIDYINLTLTLGTINGAPLSPSNPAYYYTDGTGNITRHIITAPVVFSFTKTKGIWYFYFNSSGVNIASQTVWTGFGAIAPLYRFYLSTTQDKINTRSIEWHPNTISSDQHTRLHAFGTVHISGGDIADNRIASGSPNADGRNTVIGINSLTNMDDNLQYTVTNTAVAGTRFGQDLGSIIAASLNSTNSGVFPISYNAADGELIIEDGTRFPFLFDIATNRPQFITPTGVKTLVDNGNFFVYYVYVFQDDAYGQAVRIRSSGAQYTTLALAQANTWDATKSISPTIRDNEVKQYFKVTLEYRNPFSDLCKYSAIREIIDLRRDPVNVTSTSTASVSASSVTFVPSGGLSSTNVQSALQELDSEKLSKTTTRLDLAKLGIDYCNQFLGTVVDDGILRPLTSGTGATLQRAAGLPNALWNYNLNGVSQWQTGTTATGYAQLVSDANIGSQFALGGGKFLFEQKVSISQLSTATERFQIKLGVGGSLTLNASNEISFLYDEGGIKTGSTASPKWQVVTSKSSVRTYTTISQLADVTVNQWYILKFIVNADGSTVDFYINDVLVATHTTDINSAIYNYNGIQSAIFKSVGITNVSMYVDYIGYNIIYTNPLI